MTDHSKRERWADIVQDNFMHEMVVPSKLLRQQRITAGFWADAAPSAAEIHADLDHRAGQSIRDAKRVLEYRNMYPSNPFLTRGQVGELCQKYSLAFAPLLCFAGDIPERNQEEIERFRVHPLHVMKVMSGDIRNSSLRQQIHVEFDAPVDARAPFIVPASPALGIYIPGGLKDLVHNAYADQTYAGGIERKPMVAIVHLANGAWARIDSALLQIISLDIYRPERWAPQQLLIDFFCKAFIFEHTERMIICPPSMLLQGINGFLDRGWEYHLSRFRLTSEPFGTDPIVLEPVEGGFIVVTKWDAEAIIPEVAGQTN